MELSQSVSLPLDVTWSTVERPYEAHSGTLLETHGEVRLDSSVELPFTQMGVHSSQPPWIRTELNGRPTLMRARIRYDAGMQFLEITEVRLGSDTLDSAYMSVIADFEYADLLLSYRPEDGAMRADTDELSLPAIGSARAMSAEYPAPNRSGSIRISSDEPADLSEFEEHLKAFQDLITFSSRRPAARLRLIAFLEDGTEVQIFGRTQVLPHSRTNVDPRTFTVRLGATTSPSIVKVWWSARVALRPVPQVFVGAIYQPGFVESDLIAAAAAMERFGNTKYPAPSRPILSEQQLAPIREALESVSSPDHDQDRVIRRVISNQPRAANFYLRMETLVGTLDQEVVEATRIDISAWLTAFVALRNSIAHEGSPPAPSDYELRPVRDATRSLLALLIAEHLGAPQPAIKMAASALGVRFASVYGGSLIYP